MSFSGESEGEEEGGGRGEIAFHILKFSWHPNLDHWARYMTVLLMYNVLTDEVGHEGGVALGQVLAVNHTLQTLR